MAAADGAPLVKDLDEMITAFEEAYPDFVAELQVLGITIDEYRRMLAESHPVVITTSDTVPHQP